MGTYIPNSEQEKQELLNACGFENYAAMFADNFATAPGCYVL